MNFPKIGSPELRRRSLVAGLASLPLAARAASVPSDVINMCVIGKDGWLFPAWDNLRFCDTNAVAAVTKTINTAIATLNEAKIEVALSLTPAKARIYRDHLPNTVTMAPSAEKRYGLAYDALRPSGAIMFNQATFFDAVRRTAPTVQLYFKADTHWLPVAAAAAAAEMARHIKLKSHLPPSPQPGVALSAPKPEVQSRLDLALLLPQADQARFAPEAYEVREPVATTGQASLLDDDVSDTVVVGNSFMQPGYGYASTLSSELNRPVGLVWKVHQYSPYWNILNYMRTDGFKRHRPKLIVWNFQESDMETPANLAAAWGPNAMPAADFLAELRKLVAA